MNEIAHPLYTVAIKVLEDWGMMLVDKAEPATTIFDLDEPLYLSQVNMNGAFEGTIFIIAQKDFVHSLAGNLLGASSSGDTSDEESQDAFREMANVLAGNYITEAYGNDVAFDILNPTVSEISPEKLDALVNPIFSYYFLADEAPICITFNIK